MCKPTKTHSRPIILPWSLSLCVCVFFQVTAKKKTFPSSPMNHWHHQQYFQGTDSTASLHRSRVSLRGRLPPQEKWWSWQNSQIVLAHPVRLAAKTQGLHAFFACAWCPGAPPIPRMAPCIGSTMLGIALALGARSEGMYTCSTCSTCSACSTCLISRISPISWVSWVSMEVETSRLWEPMPSEADVAVSVSGSEERVPLESPSCHDMDRITLPCGSWCKTPKPGHKVPKKLLMHCISLKIIEHIEHYWTKDCKNLIQWHAGLNWSPSCWHFLYKACFKFRVPVDLFINHFKEGVLLHQVQAIKKRCHWQSNPPSLSP